jgi:hypothetical protein
MLGSLFARREVAGGILLLLLGLGFLAASLSYPMGSARRIGTGVFPAMVSGALVLVGALVVLRGLRGAGEPLGKIAWKPLALVIAGIAAFALLLKPLGFAPATLAMILLAARAHPSMTWVSALILAAVTLVFGSAVFVYGLGLPLPLLGPALRW